MKHIMLTITLAMAGIMVTGCDDPDEGFRDRDDPDEYVCFVTEWNADGTVKAVECPGVEGDPRTVGGSCHGELMCCDVVTLGCFCADTEHGARCPSGSVAAPGPDE